jgi:GntR family transcriptional regulator, transcriptional repressor for pyruvate dehydrogenase complex
MVATRHSRTGGGQHPALEPRALQLVIMIGETGRPIGARELTRRLGEAPDGIGVSESTINRLLRRLDEQGVTRSLDGKGRVLSDAGRALAEKATTERRWHEQLGALEIRTLQDVRDLLAARRGVEREIARAAAVTATAGDVERLQRQIARHESAIAADDVRRAAAVDFHKALAEITGNQILQAVATVVFDPRFDVFEQVLDVITAGRGTTEASPHEHEEIVAAIVARDADAAEAAMVRHIDRLIDDASADVAPGTLRAIERLLRKSNPPGTQPLPR